MTLTKIARMELRKELGYGIHASGNLYDPIKKKVVRARKPFGRIVCLLVSERTKVLELQEQLKEGKKE